MKLLHALLPLLLVLGTLAPAAVLTPGYVYPFAGAGTWAGDGGAALGATLNQPRGVFVASNGDIYIADTGNNVIRKISGGNITTVAGNGSAGWSGDGGSALSAQLNGPQGVCADASGNIYIADTGNILVRKVAPNGIISTIAGMVNQQYSGGLVDRHGTYGATTVPLLGANSVALDTNGYVYVNGTDVIEGSNLRVLPEEYLGGPYEAVGADGSLYLTYNDVILKVTNPLASTTTLATSTLAGTVGSYGNTGDGGAATSATIVVNGLAVDGSGNLFFSENYPDTSTSPGTWSAVVREVSGGIISTIAGHKAIYGPYAGEGGPATAATMGYVGGLAVSGTTVWVTDGNCLRAFTIGGTITTASGNSYSGDGGVAIKAGLNRADGVAVDKVGNIFVADCGNYVIRKVDSLGRISTFAGNGTRGFAGDGGGPLAAEFQWIEGLAFNSAGDLLVADGARIRKITSAGMVTTVAGTGIYGYAGDGGPALSALIEPTIGSMAVDASDNLYFGESDAVVRELTSGGIIKTVAGTGVPGFSGDGGLGTAAQLGAANGVALAPNGDLYIADGANNRVRKVSRATGVISTFAGNGTWGQAGDGLAASNGGVELGNASSVAVDARGNVYIGESSFGTIRVVGTTGIINAFLGVGVTGDSGDGGPAALAKVNYPRALAVDAAGDLLIADYSADRVRIVGATAASLSLPPDAATNCHVYHGVLRHGDAAKIEAVAVFPAPGSAEISVYDPAAALVRKLFSGVVATGQQVMVPWDGTDDAGHPVASGAYAVRFRWPGGATVKRVVVIR